MCMEILICQLTNSSKLKDHDSVFVILFIPTSRLMNHSCKKL